MKIILVNGRPGGARSVNLSRWRGACLALCLLGLPFGVGVAAGYGTGLGERDQTDLAALETLREQLAAQKFQLDGVRDESENHVRALTIRLAQLQARLVRLDALGERMTDIAKLDAGEFDFSNPPAVGGPEQPTDLPVQPLFFDQIDQLAARLDDRERQLDILETLLADRKLQSESYLAGRPVRKGWMSSHFGARIDPFSGQRAVHEGVDFAGKENADIVAVASGVVTWSGDRHGYGNMVEVNHGGGYMTRYAHNNKNLVKVGDIVKKGQVIALMGSTGRSTGPHVHFEVYKDGRTVDPAAYVYRSGR